MSRFALLLVTLLVVSACGDSAVAASPAGIDDTSQTSEDGIRTLRQSVIVSAPIAEVWNAFTTADGYRAWAAPVAQIDFRVGGIIETGYSADARLGAPGNIRNEITAYAPERMFALRNRQAPPTCRSTCRRSNRCRRSCCSTTSAAGGRA